jgi:hypothetical protein
MTLPDEQALRRDVATVALSVADRHGFVLGGGVAWILAGLVSRPTQDVDLFSPTDRAPAAAADAVRAALQDAGFEVEDSDAGSELGDVIYGFDLDQKEFVVTREGHVVRLSLCRLDRHHNPIIMDVGPVMHLDDLVATKACALANRREPRDYIDIAAALDAGYTIDQVLKLAHEHDPALEPDDITDIGRYLDRLPDRRFLPYGLTDEQIGHLRAQFHNWPR